MQQQKLIITHKHIWSYDNEYNTEYSAVNEYNIEYSVDNEYNIEYSADNECNIEYSAGTTLYLVDVFSKSWKTFIGCST